MRFNNGMFGACICVLALLGTAIGGFVLNVHEDQREVTKYNYIADVSGLFSYSDAPEYIEYNPSSNYVGYTPGAVEYTQSSTANNFRYIIQDGDTITSDPVAITDSSDYPYDYGNFVLGTVTSGVYNPVAHFLWNGGTYNFGNTMNIHGKDVNGIVNLDHIEDDKWGSMTKFTNIVNNLGLTLSSYSKIELTPVVTGSYPILFYGGTWERNEVQVGNGYYNDYHAVLNENNALPDKIVYDVVANQVTAYRGSNVIWSNFADNVGAIINYNTVDNALADPIHNHNVSVAERLEVTATYPPVYGYMQPTAGVKATTTEATWQNGYENSVIEVKVVKNGDTSAPNQGTHFEIGADFGIDFAMQGAKLNIYYGALSDTPNWTLVNLGNWLGAQMRIDVLSGNITITPTNEVDLTKTVEPTAYSTVLEGVLTPGTLSSFKVEKANGGVMPSMKFQVTDTKVFLNTYNTVMIDPSIEITDYFPNYSDYRLNFYSFALLGSSMSINGQNCPINRDNGTITFFNVAGFEFTKKLENLYITFNEGRTYLTFVNDGSTYDLGETTSTTISFVGWWYFTTGLYEITEGMENFWNWDLNGFQATGGECLLIFLTIIGAGIIVYSVYGKGKIQLFDWIVIIFAVFIGSALLGF